MPRQRRSPVSFSRLRRSRHPLAILAVAMLVAGAMFWPRPVRAPQELAPGLYEVARAVDGDTLLLRNRTRIRLLGVDTPETKHPTRGVEFYGPEAAAFTSRLVRGRQVRLAFDRERTDRYGRFLAYVYVGDVFLNERLLREGYGRAMLRFPYSAEKKAVFRQAQAEAQATERGIWKREREPGPLLGDEQNQKQDEVR
jgi:micrococcal nuclease